MSFVSKTRTHSLRGMGCPQSPLQGMAALAVATRKSSSQRRLLRLGSYVLGDMGRTAAGRPSVFRQRFSLRGLGDITCSIDPATGGRVCTNDPGTGAAAAATTPAANWNCNGVVSPRYLPDPTSQKWDWNVNTPATWMFQGRPDPNSVYDVYVRQDNSAFAAVGPGGGFQYNTSMRATVPAYSTCPTAAATPAATPATTTIQPAAVPASLPAPLVSTVPAAAPPRSSAFGNLSIGQIALYGGGGIAALLVLKKFLK